MKTRISLSTFRRISRLEEQVLRATMPKTAARSVEPLPAFAAPQAGEVVAVRNGYRLVRPVSFTLGEVARG